MKEKNIFNVDRLYSASTNKVVLNVHCSSFPIDKVKLRAASYESKENIDFYLDFPTFQTLAADAESGRLFTKLASKQYQLFTGYEREGQVISRQLSISYSEPRVFVTIQEGPGRKTETGAILPVKGAEISKRISVPIDVATFRQMMIYTSNCITSYLSAKISRMLSEYDNMRFSDK